MKKITLKFLKDNLNLKLLIKELDKQINDSDDNILNAVMDTYQDLIDDDGMEISMIEHLIDLEEKKQDKLNQKIRDLSANGKLLQTLSNNFKYIRQIHIKLDYDECYFDCVFSKINKTYYLILNHRHGYNFYNGIIYKSKSEDNLNKQYAILRKQIIDADNVSVIKTY